MNLTSINRQSFTPSNFVKAEVPTPSNQASQSIPQDGVLISAGLAPSESDIKTFGNGPYPNLAKQANHQLVMATKFEAAKAAVVSSPTTLMMFDDGMPHLAAMAEQLRDQAMAFEALHGPSHNPKTLSMFGDGPTPNLADMAADMKAQASAFEVYQGVQEAERANRDLLKNLATETTQQLKAITQQVERERFASMTPAQQQQHLAAENFMVSMMAR